MHDQSPTVTAVVRSFDGADVSRELLPAASGTAWLSPLRLSGSKLVLHTAQNGRGSKRHLLVCVTRGLGQSGRLP